MSAAKARGATVVIMTHRSGILAAADKLLVLKDGQVVQFGPRDMILGDLRKTAVQSGQVRAVGSRGQA
jgi:ATP-binding cassette subfamily C exporter for protease/lipase